MGGFQFGIMNDNLDRFKAISKDFNLLTDYKDKLNFYLLHSDFLDLDITKYWFHTEKEEEIFVITDLEYHINIAPQTEEERRLFNIICCCPNIARVYGLKQYDKYDFEGVLAQCIEIEKAKIEKTTKEHSLPMEYVEAKIKDYNDKLEDSNCHRIKNDFDFKKRTIEKQIYDTILRNEVINYDYFLSKEIISLYMPEGYMSVVRLGFGIINVHILHYLEGELNKFRNTGYLKEILQNQKKSSFQSITKFNNEKEPQNMEDLGIEDYKEIFIKSFFGETVNIQEISDYFEYESVRFMNRFSNESLTQRIKDIIFKKFIKGIEEANTNLSNPFIEREYKRLLEISDLKVQGVDISEIEKPSRYNGKIPLPYLCKKFGFGIHIALEQIEYIYKGFELFKKQHEENNNVTTPNDNQWIKDLVKEKYKYYGFEEHIGLNYDFPFVEHKKGDIDFNNQKWACVNWYVRNLNTVHRDLLNNLEMLPKEKVKEQIMFAYNKQIEVFQDWDLRQGVYVEYYNTMEEVSKLSGSQIPNGYYDIYRLKWLFISACFIKFYKVLLDKYFSEQPEAPAPTATAQDQPKPETDLTDDQKIIYKHIEHLKGNNLNREKIMSDENFKQLFNDLCYLVENNTVPEIKKPLSLNGITSISLLHTIRLIHNDLIKTRKIRQSFKIFLKTYFHQLSNYSNMDVEFSKAIHKPNIYPF